MKNRAFFFQRFQFLSALLLLFFLTSCSETFTTPGIEAGRIDLSSYDFQKKPAVRLNGQWQFFFKKFLTGDIADSQATYIEVPGSFGGRQFQEKTLPQKGWATYRLLIKVKPGQSLALFHLEQGLNYQVFVNGRLLTQAGQPAETRELEVPQTLPSLSFFRADKEWVDLRVLLSNHQYRKGGLWNAIYLGSPATTLGISEFYHNKDLVLLGAFLFIGIYHLGLFLIRRKEFELLLFSLFSFDVSLRLGTTGPRVLVSFFEAMPFAVYVRIELLSWVWAIPLVVHYLRYIFPGHVKGWLVKTGYLLSAGFTVFVIFAENYSDMVVPSQLAFFTIAIIGYGQVSRAAWQRAPGALMFLISSALMLLTVLNDILHVNEIIHSFYASPLGILAFMVTQAILLARVYFIRIQTHAELQEQEKQRLDQAVKERTHELEKANQAKSNFLATMSHEIRTPLNAILGMSDLLSESQLNQEQQRYLNLVQNSSSMLRDLLNDILDYTKIEAGKLELFYSNFDQVELVHQVADSYRVLAQKNGVDLEVITSQSESWVRADRLRLRQVLINLVSNAVKFTNQGKITISLVKVEEEAGMFRYSVKDTGTGISPKHQQRLFDNFYQVDSSASRPAAGTGLGLAIVARLLKLMNSSIQLESSPGVGSDFTFLLKLQQAQKPETAPVPDTARLNSKSRVLVVEDDAANQELIELLLKKMNLSPDIVHNGRAAIEAVRQKDYDIIFMDIMMPGINGLEATKEIRRLVGDNVAIVACTANTAREDQEKYLAAGMNTVLAKPYSKSDLQKTLLQYIPLEN